MSDAARVRPLEEDFERDLHTEHQILNMGPSHPATHGTVKFLIELDGENIVDLDIQVGYLQELLQPERAPVVSHPVTASVQSLILVDEPYFNEPVSTWRTRDALSHSHARLASRETRQ